MNLKEMSKDTNAQSKVILARLLNYAQLESPTGNRDALGELAALIIKDFAQLGAVIGTEQHDTGDHLILDIPGAGALAGNVPILILAHHDTVWPVGTLQTMPLSRDEDILRGPGIYDMKSGLAILHEALRILQQEQAAYSPVRLIIVADEEIGSPTARALVESQLGQVSCALGLEPPHPDGALKTSRWGSTRIRLSVIGHAAHAALEPENGVSAIDELVDQLCRVRVLLQEYPSVLCNVGTISGGGRTNVIAAQAEAEIGLRFTDADTETEVLAKFAGLRPLRMAATLNVEIISNRPAWGETALGEELLATVKLAAADVGQELEGRPASGAADTNVTGWCGIPSLDGFGALGRGAHAADEQIYIPSLAPRAHLLAAVIHRGVSGPTSR